MKLKLISALVQVGSLRFFKALREIEDYNKFAIQGHKISHRVLHLACGPQVARLRHMVKACDGSSHTVV